MAKNLALHTARWWKNLEDKNVQCFLCPRHCLIKKGSRGFCFVRQNMDGNFVAASYGHTSGFAIDPIEKKPLYHFYPGENVLSFGTIGCNLGCKFCQNWHMSRAEDLGLLIEDASPQDIASAAKRAQCKSVAFTYNEPIINAEYVIDAAQECRRAGIATVAVTDGYIGAEARDEFFENINAANVDLKAFTERFYEKLCSAKLQPVLDTLVFIKKETKTWLELTNLIISGENDSEGELKAMARWIVENLGSEVPMHFSAFHPSFQMMTTPVTPKETLAVARAIALSAGLKYVYTGNVYDPEGACTYCKHCGKVVIRRNGYEVKEYHLKNSQCEFCNTTCDGVFK